MATPSLISGIHDAVWSALEGWPAWAALVPVGNRIKWQNTTADPRKPQGGAPADFAQCEFEPDWDWDCGGFEEGKTFAVENQSFDPLAGCWVASESFVFRLTLTGRKLKLSESDDILMETREALLRAGPKLGLSYIINWTMSVRSRLAVESGTRRIESALALRVTVSADGASLL